MGRKKAITEEAPVQSWLKRPRKPQLPYLGPIPQEFVKNEKTINIWEGMTLDALVKEVPEGVSFTDLFFGRESDYEDSYTTTLSYTVSEKNPTYGYEMKQYEKRKVEYEERMEVYRADKKVYDNWHKMTEEEKKGLEAQRLATVRAAKIKKLETELAKLKEG